MVRDYYGELLRLAATDGNAAFDKATEFLSGIELEITLLRNQQEYVAQVRSYLFGKDAAQESIEATTVPTLERRTRIKEAAMALVSEGHKTLTAKMVVERLEQMLLDLDVNNPGAVMGTVLNNLVEFDRKAVGQFEFIDRRQWATLLRSNEGRFLC